MNNCHYQSFQLLRSLGNVNKEMVSIMKSISHMNIAQQEFLYLLSSFEIGCDPHVTPLDIPREVNYYSSKNLVKHSVYPNKYFTHA